MSAPRPPTRGPHFFADAADVGDGWALLRGDDAHHLARVLRARAGDPVSVADGRGALWQATVAAVDGHVEVTLDRLFEVPPPQPRLTVVHALPKGRKLEEVVQRLSEIGVDRLVPASSARSQVRLDGQRAERALRRWRAVALAAAKQSRRARVLEVAAPRTWSEAVAQPAQGVVLWEEASTPLRDAVAALGAPDGVAALGARELVLAVGPEGGLDAAEVRACGLVPVSLGATVLRTETAAVVAAALVLSRLGRLG